MTNFSMAELIARADSAGTAVTGTSAASLLPASAKAILPGNLLRVGQRFRLRASGIVSNIVVTPGTLTLDVRMAGVVAFDGGAVQLNAVAKTNVTWELDVSLAVVSIGDGTLATIRGTGKWTSESVVGSPLPSVGGAGVALLPAASPAAGTGFDSTAAVSVDLFAKFSLTGNSIQALDYELISLN